MKDTMGATGSPESAFQDIAEQHLAECPLATTMGGPNAGAEAVARLCALAERLSEHVQTLHGGACPTHGHLDYACYLLARAAVGVSTVAVGDMSMLDQAMDAIDDDLGRAPAMEEKQPKEERMSKSKTPAGPVSLATIIEHLRQRGRQAEVKGGKVLVDGIVVPLTVVDGVVALGAFIENRDASNPWVRLRGRSWPTFKAAILDAIDQWLSLARAANEEAAAKAAEEKKQQALEARLVKAGFRVGWADYGKPDQISLVLTHAQAEALLGGKGKAARRG